LKFKREFDQICEMLQPTEQLDYLQFKTFMLHVGMLSEQQAMTESRENNLMYEVWYSLGQVRDSEETIRLEDLRVFLMAI